MNVRPIWKSRVSPQDEYCTNENADGLSRQVWHDVEENMDNFEDRKWNDQEDNSLKKAP